MRPVIIIKGVPQLDDGEAWAFDNNVRMVEWDEPVAWNFKTEKPTGWQRRRCPAPLYDAIIPPEGIRRAQRRVPSVQPSEA